jgi:signal peptidase I
MNPARFLRDLCVVLVAVGCVVWGVTRWLMIPWVVAGPSMEPTLQEGDRVLVNLITLRGRLPRTGEIVVLSGPGGENMVKRIAREPYPGEAPYPASILTPDSPLEPSFVVLGDNKDQSLDSRTFGRVPRHCIRGRAVWRYWPLTRLGSIE